MKSLVLQSFCARPVGHVDQRRLACCTAWCLRVLLTTRKCVRLGSGLLQRQWWVIPCWGDRHKHHPVLHQHPAELLPQPPFRTCTSLKQSANINLHII